MPANSVAVIEDFMQSYANKNEIFYFAFMQNEGEDDDEGENKPAAAKARKEKSVLQAKLTKLAIKIGYVGTSLSISLAPFLLFFGQLLLKWNQLTVVAVSRCV